ncbi:hypothetical protein ADUPG1_012302, partial [Aduncisulcus paluster]
MLFADRVSQLIEEAEHIQLIDGKNPKTCLLKQFQEVFAHVDYIPSRDLREPMRFVKALRIFTLDTSRSVIGDVLRTYRYSMGYVRDIETSEECTFTIGRELAESGVMTVISRALQFRRRNNMPRFAQSLRLIRVIVDRKAAHTIPSCVYSALGITATSETHVLRSYSISILTRALKQVPRTLKACGAYKSLLMAGTSFYNQMCVDSITDALTSVFSNSMNRHILDVEFTLYHLLSPLVLPQTSSSASSFQPEQGNYLRIPAFPFIPTNMHHGKVRAACGYLVQFLSTPGGLLLMTKSWYGLKSLVRGGVLDALLYPSDIVQNRRMCLCECLCNIFKMPESECKLPLPCSCTNCQLKALYVYHGEGTKLKDHQSTHSKSSSSSLSGLFPTLAFITDVSSLLPHITSTSPSLSHAHTALLLLSLSHCGVLDALCILACLPDIHMEARRREEKRRLGQSKALRHARRRKSKVMDQQHHGRTSSGTVSSSSQHHSVDMSADEQTVSTTQKERRKEENRKKRAAHLVFSFYHRHVDRYKEKMRKRLHRQHEERKKGWKEEGKALQLGSGFADPDPEENSYSDSDDSFSFDNPASHLYISGTSPSFLAPSFPLLSSLIIHTLSMFHSLSLALLPSSPFLSSILRYNTLTHISKGGVCDFIGHEWCGMGKETLSSFGMSRAREILMHLWCDRKDLAHGSDSHGDSKNSSHHGDSSFMDGNNDTTTDTDFLSSDRSDLGSTFDKSGSTVDVTADKVSVSKKQKKQLWWQSSDAHFTEEQGGDFVLVKNVITHTEKTQGELREKERQRNVRQEMSELKKKKKLRDFEKEHSSAIPKNEAEMRKVQQKDQQQKYARRREKEAIRLKRGAEHERMKQKHEKSKVSTEAMKTHKEMVQPSNNDSSSTETTNHSSITTSKLTQDLLSGSSSSISSSETTAYAESHISEHHRP